MSNPIVTRLIDNARKLGHESHTVAGAAYLQGITVYSLCCWCAEHVEGEATRLPRGGECDRCAYAGHDCLVIVPTLEQIYEAATQAYRAALAKLAEGRGPVSEREDTNIKALRAEMIAAYDAMRGAEQAA